MNKNKTILVIIALFSIVAFSSCSNLFNSKNNVSSDNSSYSRPTNKYGSYLSGRVAHLRRDFNLASNYYMTSLSIETNKDLLSKIYIMLASERRVDEAAKYARKAIENGDNNNFTHLIIAVDDFNKGQYKLSRDRISKIDSDIYKEFITPLFVAWSYAGENDKEKALASIKKMSTQQAFGALYDFHAGMINDYFDDFDEAKTNYDVIVNQKSSEMSFRSLQVITNLYLRMDKKEEAIELVEKYYDDQYISDMLKRLLINVKNSNQKSVKKIVNKPDIGLSEALFSIAASLRQGEGGTDLAHIFISMSIYENHDYDLAKLMLADILQSRELYADSIRVYDEIPKYSEAYYVAQLKKSTSFVLQNDYQSSINVLLPIARDNPKNYQVLLELADSYRMNEEYKKAISNYNQAIKSLDKIESKHWIAYYTLGIAYDKNGDFKNSQKNLKKSLELKPDNFLTLNYLGYSWLDRGVNIEEAFAMIVKSYNQMPNSGHITDSLGWAFYKLNKYDYAVKYLDKASELEPANALISDHLGDVYWQSGRKTEAVYQWERALILEKDIKEVDIKQVEEKISNGLKVQEKLQYEEKTIDEIISTIEE